MAGSRSSTVPLHHALGLGIRTLAKGWWLAVPVTVALAAVQVWVGYRLVEGATGMQNDAGRESVAQVLLAIAAFLGLYTAIQLAKGTRASRLSWIPSLFMVPFALAGAGLWMLDGSMAPAALSFVHLAWGLVFAVFGGAVLAVLFVDMGEQVRTTNQVDPSFVLARLRSQWLDVSVPHGARVHAVQLGLQALVVPGVYFAAQLAFTAPIAVLHPEERVLQRSARLTDGIRSRILQLLFVGLIVVLAVDGVVGVLIDGPERTMQALVLPFAASETASFVRAIADGLVWGVIDVALLAMYQARLERLRELARERAAREGARAP